MVVLPHSPESYIQKEKVNETIILIIAMPRLDFSALEFTVTQGLAVKNNIANNQ